MSQGFTKDYLVKATGETDVFVNGTKQASTSGVCTDGINFTIPSGVKKITLSLRDVSTDTTTLLGLRLGDSSGIAVTGYSGTYSQFSNGTSNVVNAVATSVWWLSGNDAAAFDYDGVMELTLHDAATNTWIVSTQTSAITGATERYDTMVGALSLSGELTTVQFYGNIGNWDAGSVNIQYENPDLAVSGIESVAAGVTDVFVNGTLQATTSGTEYDFTVPSGITEFKLALNDVSFDANSELRVQLGDAGGIETTGYDSVASYIQGATTASVADTAGFDIANTGATLHWGGVYHFVLMDAATNLWACSAVLGTGDGTVTAAFIAGSKALSGELTTVRLTTAGGTAVGDSGSVNIQYDNQELDLGSGVISGGVVQAVHTHEGDRIAGTAIIPLDDTIPQITEGTEGLTASITPNNVANKLRIDVVMNLGVSATNEQMQIALFQDSTADALASSTGNWQAASGELNQISLTHWMDAGTTASTTFSVRFGGHSSGTFAMNGPGARLHGGVNASSITITEYKA